MNCFCLMFLKNLGKIFFISLIFFNFRTKLGNTGVPLFRHSAAILDGIMFIVGGNSYNDSLKSKVSNYNSNQLLAFDISNILIFFYTLNYII